MALWADKKDLDAQATKLGEIETKLGSVVSKEDLDSVKTEFTTGLEQIKAALAGLTTRKEDPPAHKEDPVDPTTAVLTDPASFVDSRTKPLLDAQLQTQADLNEMRARQKFGAVFAQYGDDLVKMAQNMPLAERAKSNFWDAHIRMVLGHKVVQGEITQGNFPSLLGSSTTGVNVDGSGKDPNHGLDPAIAEFLKKKGVPLEQAAKIQNLYSQGEPISMASVKGTSVH